LHLTTSPTFLSYTPLTAGRTSRSRKAEVTWSRCHLPVQLITSPEIVEMQWTAVMMLVDKSSRKFVRQTRSIKY